MVIILLKKEEFNYIFVLMGKIKIKKGKRILENTFLLNENMGSGSKNFGTFG